MKDFTLENPLTNSDRSPDAADEDDEASVLFMIERDHMPSPDYLTRVRLGEHVGSIRSATLSLISRLCCGFNLLLPYLAVNYLDRFLSGHCLHAPKPWILRLLAVSCVALASKMLKMELPLIARQGYDGGLISEATAIQRMEMMILGALKWRMRSVTPFSFVSFFIDRFNHDNPPWPLFRRALKERAIEIILKAQHDGRLLEFKPSVMAASAVLVAAHELFLPQYPGFKSDILSCSFVIKEELSLCYDAMQGVVKEGYESGLDVDSSANTPSNILDNRFSCPDSDRATVRRETDNKTAPGGGWPEKARVKRRKTH